MFPKVAEMLHGRRKLPKLRTFLLARHLLAAKEGNEANLSENIKNIVKSQR